MLKINKMKVTFGEQVALNIKDEITFEKNDRIGIIGSNGAGKSTLINCLLGLIPYQGQVDSTISPKEMAVHLQENNYSSNVRVKLVLETILGVKIKESQELQDLINYFDFESCLLKKFNKLSGGQKQRLTLIMVLMEKAQLTFFDEVSSGLDFETRQLLMDKLINWYNGQATALCVVSHYYDELEKLTNKLLLLEKGEVVAFGSKDELFQKYCGYSVITVEETGAAAELFKSYRKLAAPAQIIALACDNASDELGIVNLCVQHNINYKRRNNDIEIMTLNAKVQEGYGDGKA